VNDIAKKNVTGILFAKENSFRYLEKEKCHCHEPVHQYGLFFKYLFLRGLSLYEKPYVDVVKKKLVLLS